MSSSFSTLTLEQLRQQMAEHESKRPKPFEQPTEFKAWMVRKDELRFWLDLAAAKEANTWKDVPCPDRVLAQPPAPKPIEDPMPQKKKYATEAERKAALAESKLKYARRKAEEKKANRPKAAPMVAGPEPEFIPAQREHLVKPTAYIATPPTTITGSVLDRIHHLRALTWSLLSDLEAMDLAQLAELKGEVAMFDAAAQATCQVLTVRGIA